MTLTKGQIATLTRGSNFIKTFAEIFRSNETAVQDSDHSDEEEAKEEFDENFDEKDKKALLKFNSNKKSRAESLSELNERLQKLPKNQKGLTSAEKKLRNAIKKQKRKEKQKINQIHKNRPSKVGSVLDGTNKIKKEIEEAKPESKVTNGLVYSKIDFPNDEVKKVKKDPKKTLEKLKKQKEKLNMLRESGDIEKAVQIKSKSAFVSALAKSQGEKVLDDPILLQKSIKKKEQKAKQSKRKWDNRLETVTKRKDDRQKKRQENIEKRKKSKKDNKIKKATKRGRITV